MYQLISALQKMSRVFRMHRADAVTIAVALVLAFQFSFPQHASAAAVKHASGLTYENADLVTLGKTHRAMIEHTDNSVNNVDGQDESIEQNVLRSVTVTATAYSSSRDETDDTPFITASGARVADGTLAANFLRFGTEVRLPDLFGDKIFVVEDRMHPRFSQNHVDIWMPQKSYAKQFGIALTRLEILD